jgi:hypothetical protein
LKQSSHCALARCSSLRNARRLADPGLISERPQIQFVMGVGIALPAEERLLDIILAEAWKLFSHWTWAGIGRIRAWSCAERWPAAQTPFAPAWMTQKNYQDAVGNEQFGDCRCRAAKLPQGLEPLQ